MKLTTRTTHSFIEIKVDEIETTLYKSYPDEIKEMIDNLRDVIEDLLTYTNNENTTMKSSAELIEKLTSRPHLKDNDGYYDFILDKEQMIEIVDKFLSDHQSSELSKEIERLKGEREWISVEDRLPELNRNGFSYQVLTLSKLGGMEVVAYDYEFMRWCGDPYRIITFWMPLPTPSKEQ